jgi:phage-related protein
MYSFISKIIKFLWNILSSSISFLKNILIAIKIQIDSRKNKTQINITIINNIENLHIHNYSSKEEDIRSDYINELNKKLKRKSH